MVPGATSQGSLFSALVAAVSGIAPHVLHHVGPLAGSAFVAGVGGTILFGILGFALSIPMLVRLRRRFGTRLAPAVAAAIFLAVYLLSTSVVGPALTRFSLHEPSPAITSTPVPSGHDDHHP